MSYNACYMISILVGSYTTFYAFQRDLPSGKRGFGHCRCTVGHC